MCVLFRTTSGSCRHGTASSRQQPRERQRRPNLPLAPDAGPVCNAQGRSPARAWLPLEGAARSD